VEVRGVVQPGRSVLATRVEIQDERDKGGGDDDDDD
jgi:hypothetical protein